MINLIPKKIDLYINIVVFMEKNFLITILSPEKKLLKIYPRLNLIKNIKF